MSDADWTADWIESRNGTKHKKRWNDVKVAYPTLFCRDQVFTHRCIDVIANVTRVESL